MGHGVIQAACAGRSWHTGTHCWPMTAGGAESGDEAQSAGAPEAAAGSPESEARGGGGKGLQFSDKDEHMYFWFPLLAGLSELTFDPRPDIRYSALEVHHMSGAPSWTIMHVTDGAMGHSSVRPSSCSAIASASG